MNIIDKLIQHNVNPFFDKLAEFLSLKDLLSFAHTCHEWRSLCNVCILYSLLYLSLG